MALFCDRLKEERNRLRYGQGEFAELAGVNRRSQVNYEKGDRSPNADYLLAISKAGVDIAYILTGNRLPKAIDDKLAAALSLSVDREPEGGELTNLALEAYETVGNEAGSSVAEPPSPVYLSGRELNLVDNYRRSNGVGKLSLEVSAKALAQQAASDKPKEEKQ